MPGVSAVSDPDLHTMISLIFGPVFKSSIKEKDAPKGNKDKVSGNGALAEAAKGAVVVQRRMSRHGSAMMQLIDETKLFSADGHKSHWAQLASSSWETLKLRYSENLYDKVEEAKLTMARNFDNDPGRVFQTAIYSKVYRDAR